ncbi:MAG: heme exporter protein CcmB [Bdellovibrionota bacterium]
MLTLLRKDIRCLIRAKEWLAAVFLFALVLVVLASFAFRQIGYGAEELRSLTPGVVWTIFFFCGATSLNYGFVLEREVGALEGLLLSPVDPALVYLSKCISGFVFLLLLQAFVLTSFGTLFGVDLFASCGPLLSLSAAVTFGFVALGTLLASMAACLPGRDIILPLLLFPLSLPLLSGAVLVTREILSTGGIHYGGFWFLLVAGFDVISFTLAVILFEYAVREQ